MSNSLIENPEKEVLTIQFLGTKDDLVSPEDNIDFVTGKTFRYMEVPKSTHKNIINMNYEDRKDRFKKALICDKKEVLNENSQDSDFLNISDLQDRALQKSNKEIKNVVFAIHGIRSEGFWSKKIGLRVKKLGNKKQAESWKTETSTYGYFGMIPFLSPYLRRNKVEWLMNKYIENLALYPCADFHYVGHSNGTYLVAKALQEYPCCRFKHIVFAGSVVRRNYPWQKKIDSKQVEKVLNFVATADWVVGIFPHIFEQLPFRQDLGGAGYQGFEGLEEPEENSSNQSYDFIYEKNQYETNQDATIHQLKYITGDHGAALKEENWDLIANFIVNGTVSFEKEIFPLEEVMEENQTQKLWKKERNPCVKILSEFPLITWLVLLTIVISIGFIAYFIIFNLLAISILAKTILITIFFIFYLFVLYMFLTRF